MRILLIPIVFAFLLLIFAAVGLTGSINFNSGSSDGGVYKSINGGDSFELKPQIIEEKNASLNKGVTQVSQGTSSETLFASVPNEGVFRTTNGADTWRRVFVGDVMITSFTPNPANSNQLYVSVVYERRARIYRINIDSREWDEIYVETAQGTNFVSLVVNPDNTNQIYGLLSNGVLITSYNQGEDWILAHDLDTIVKDLHIDPTNPRIVYILTSQNLYSSTDGGYVFTKLPVELTGRSIAGVEIISFAVNPANNKEIYIGGTGELIRSTDGGQTWNSITILTPNGPVPIQAITINPSNSNIVHYAAGSVFYTSQNRGQSWSTSELPGRVSSVNTIVVDDENSDIIYLGVN